MPIKKGRVTIRDVAKRAEVAPITVSRAINNSGYISPETRRRVEATIAELNYIPNTLSQSLRFQKTDMIALLVSDITNPFWTTVTRGVEDICNIHGLNLILCNTDEQNEKLENYIRLLLQRQTDGFLIVPTGYDSNMIESVTSNHVPIVLLDRVLPGSHIPAIISDNKNGAYRLTEHLINLGHRRISILSGKVEQSTSLQRVEGYRQALTDYGIPIDDELIIYGNFTQQSGYDAAMRVLNDVHPRPTALFAGNNFIAYGMQRAAMDCNLRIPQDISLVAFDDLPFQTYPPPFLTTAVQNPYRIGQEAANLLIKQIHGESAEITEDIILPIEIIVRDSSAPVKS